jgi:hypothetical protein
VGGLPFEWRRRLLQVRHAPEQIVSPLLRPALVPASVTVETTGAEATLVRWQTSTLSLHRRALVETNIVCFVFALQLCGWPSHESHPPALQKMPDFIGAKVADLHRNLSGHKQPEFTVEPFVTDARPGDEAKDLSMLAARHPGQRAVARNSASCLACGQ